MRNMRFGRAVVFRLFFAIMKSIQEAICVNRKTGGNRHSLFVRVIAAVCAVLVAVSAFLFLFFGG